MPADILQKDEFKTILEKAEKEEVVECLLNGTSYDEFKEFINNDEDLADIRSLFSGISETLREYLDLRDTDKISTSTTKYTRRKNGISGRSRIQQKSLLTFVIVVFALVAFALKITY